MYFAVWAPNAAGICVVGDFNNWCGDNYEMRRHDDSGIFELLRRTHTKEVFTNTLYILRTAECYTRLIPMQPIAREDRIMHPLYMILTDISGMTDSGLQRKKR